MLGFALLWAGVDNSGKPQTENDSGWPQTEKYSDGHRTQNNQHGFRWNTTAVERQCLIQADNNGGEL